MTSWLDLPSLLWLILTGASEMVRAEAVFPGGQPLTAEEKLARPGGSRIAVSITCSPLYDENGRLVNIIANVVDITRFREEEEMKSTTRICR